MYLPLWDYTTSTFSIQLCNVEESLQNTFTPLKASAKEGVRVAQVVSRESVVIKLSVGGFRQYALVTCGLKYYNKDTRRYT